MTEEQFLQSYNVKKYTQFSIATDIVCFSLVESEAENYRRMNNKSFSILLIKRGGHPFKDKWALPGGFLKEDETLEQTAERELLEETGLKPSYIEQLYSFSDINRDPRTRVISASYIAFLNKPAILKAASDAKEARWFEIELSEDDKLTLTNGDIVLTEQELAFDHERIIKFAMARLRGKIEYTNIALNLLPQYFTLTELQRVYEKILGKPLLAANFRRKVQDIVEETELREEGKGYRPPKLYTKKPNMDNVQH